MAKKLNQLVAIEKSIKTQCGAVLTNAYQAFQKPAQLAGLAKTYASKQEGGDRYPAEQQRVQVRASETIAEVRKALVELVNAVASKDATNCVAKADIVVDGITLAKDVPATQLLWLEKQVTDWKTFISKLPVLDNTEGWDWDPNQNCFSTRPTETARVKKTSEVYVIPGTLTDKHPAQVATREETVVEGYWTTIKYSGALPAADVKALFMRVEKLLRAIQTAHQEANMTISTPLEIGDALLGYIFNK